MDLKTLSILTLLGVLLSVPSAAQAPAMDPAGELRQLAEAFRAEAGAPALGLLVADAEGHPRVAVAGHRLAGSGDAVATEDRWHWGSVTKSMTATLVARLVERGIVDWDDTVAKWLGEAVPGMDDSYRSVTFVHLLSHHSGLPANIPMARFGEFSQDPEDPMADRIGWVRIALAMEPLDVPGAAYHYSNNGFIVAGAMLEAATGETWETLLIEHVFDPLGMASAGFGPPRGEEPEAQPRGHRPQGGTDTPVPMDADNPAALGPAGRVHMSLGDMARYLRAHSERPKSFLKGETWDLLHQPPFEGFYALGWVVTGHESRWHNGSNTMWYAEVAFRRDHPHFAAVVVNDGDLGLVKPAVSSLLERLMTP